MDGSTEIGGDCVSTACGMEKQSLGHLFMALDLRMSFLSPLGWLLATLNQPVALAPGQEHSMWAMSGQNPFISSTGVAHAWSHSAFSLIQQIMN